MSGTRRIECGLVMLWLKILLSKRNARGYELKVTWINVDCSFPLAGSTKTLENAFQSISDLNWFWKLAKSLHWFHLHFSCSVAPNDSVEFSSFLWFVIPNLLSNAIIPMHHSLLEFDFKVLSLRENGINFQAEDEVTQQFLNSNIGAVCKWPLCRES